MGLRVSRSPALQGISSARAGTGTTASQRAPRPSPPRVRPACVRNARCNYKWPVATDGGRRCDDGACVPRGGAARPLPPTTGLFRTATPALPLAHARSHIKARTLMQTRADVRHTQRRAQSRTHSLTYPRAHSDTQTDTQTRRHAPARHLACRDSFHASRDSHRQMPLCVQAHTFQIQNAPMALRWRAFQRCANWAGRTGGHPPLGHA